MEKRILCYGDSNTWGVIPRWVASSMPSERYDEKTRWPMVMKTLLGSSWQVIEEGLGGRTTMFDAPGEEYRRGDFYLHPCLLSHRPLDYVIIMLGTNDIQPRLHPGTFDLNDLKKGMIRLIELVRSLPECGVNGHPSNILLIAPPPIKVSKGRPDVSKKYDFENGCRLSGRFAEIYAEVAKIHDCEFLNAAEYAEADDSDGVHFTMESHPRLGKAVAEKITLMEKRVKHSNFSSISLRANIEM